MKAKLIFASLFLSMAGLSAQTYQVPVSEQDEPMMKGKFEPTWSSLENYQVPEWFRNVKFGIWAHWGPQCVEGSGDWMARSMYMEGTREYEYHVKHYGHPSEVGFKDIIPLWKAENWDPDRLVAFYKKIGAQYFFALGNHHDNMDLWDSKYQPWNSVNMGPKKDILAGWEKAARKYGLYFGVSLHADHAWSWYEPSQRHDTKGPKKGIPYDGKLTKADGKGKWWEGYDPQDLYAQNHPLSENSWDNGMIHRQWAWGNGVCVPSHEFCTNFYNRTLDVINRYNPDLLYFDVTVAPFYPVSDAGLKIAAHFYNHNMATHKGKLEAVMFGKILDENQRKALVWDVERGAPNKIIDQPWQSCSCIGGWHYNTSIYEKNEYKSAAYVAKLLVDIVSKNGNLLLNVGPRADGTIPESQQKVLREIGHWLQVNGEAIYETRPWIKSGEGPNKGTAGYMTDSEQSVYTSKDIRFTTRKDTLYATVLSWTDGFVTIESLSEDVKPVHSVSMLGCDEQLDWIQNKSGLTVKFPEEKPTDYAHVLKIQ